ncbi:MAG: hypothetical protein LRY71_11390 [Bacillaceae bacterium]|nr:hypothetical protein [Bacillaceae bacterium]
MGNIVNKLMIIVGTCGLLLVEFSPYEGIIAIALAIAISGLLEYFNQEEYNEAVRRHHSEQGSFETGTATEKVARKVLDYIEE